MYGTTSCEATHAEMKRFFSQVRQQTQRRARIMTDLFSLKKVLCGLLQRQSFAKHYTPSELLRYFSSIVRVGRFAWSRKRLTNKTSARSIVDLAALLPGSKISTVHVGAKRRRV